MAWESKYVVKALPLRIQPFGVMGLFRESERTREPDRPRQVCSLIN